VLAYEKKVYRKFGAPRMDDRLLSVDEATAIMERIERLIRAPGQLQSLSSGIVWFILRNVMTFWMGQLA
jgi:hypothetical protein